MEMKRHQFHIRRQAEELRKAKASLPAGGAEVILQTDFAERYSIEQQNEVMQAHWTKTTPGISIYTAVVYYRDCNNALKWISYGIVSDSLKQSAYEVVTYNRRIMDDLKNRGLATERVHLWTDGAASQFKNRWTQMANTADERICSHNFAESYHGKGPHDGIGATLKNKIWRKVLAGQLTIRNANDFHESLASDSELAVTVLFVGRDEVVGAKSELDVLFADVKATRGIQAARAILTEEWGIITLLQNTGDEPQAGTQRILKTSQPDLVEALIGEEEVEEDAVHGSLHEPSRLRTPTDQGTQMTNYELVDDGRVSNEELLEVFQM